MTTFMADIAAVVMSLTMGSSGVVASVGNYFGNADGVRGNRGVCANFADENGDGVCDNRVDSIILNKWKLYDIMVWYEQTAHKLKLK